MTLTRRTTRGFVTAFSSFVLVGTMALPAHADPGPGTATATWDGATVALIEIDPPSDADLADAEFVGIATNFTSADSAVSCLNGDDIRVYVDDFYGYVATNRFQAGQCVSVAYLMQAVDRLLAVHLIDNTRDSEVPDPTYVPLVPDANLTAQKLADLATLRPQVVALLAGADPATVPCMPTIEGGNCHGAPPVAKTLTNVTIHRQETSYTCAPASARTLLSSFGISDTEASLATEMRTRSSDGTYWVNLRDTLNRRQNRDPIIGEPEHGGLTADELMSRVVYDVARVRSGHYHPAILNVDQYRLQYWGNPAKTGRHYLTSYGYDTRDQGKLVLGDVAQSKHGSHTVPLAEALRATVANKGLVLF